MNASRDKEKLRINREVEGKIADLVLDLIKLIFAGVILAGILGMSANKMMLVITGGAICIILFVLWYVLFIRSKRKD